MIFRKMKAMEIGEQPKLTPGIETAFDEVAKNMAIQARKAAEIAAKQQTITKAKD